MVSRSKWRHGGTKTVKKGKKSPHFEFSCRMSPRVFASLTRAIAPPKAVAVLIVPKLKSDTSAALEPL